MTVCIIAEKGDAAGHIAKALAEGKPKKIKSEYGVDFYEFSRNGKKHLVVAAVGHLFNLKQSKKMKGWSYPVFDVEWRPSYKVRKASAFSEKYFRTLEDIAEKNKKAECIIACDYDNEGTVIGYNILKFIFHKENAKRMKFSTLTKPDLIESYENIMKEIDWNNLECGLARHMIDFFYGISTSRALTSAIKNYAKRFSLLTAGRVQGPTLYFLFEREKLIQKFKPKPFWLLQALIKIGNQEIIASHDTSKFWKEDEAEQAFKNSKGDAIVENATKKEYFQNPPTPFNITSLQTEAYKLFGYTPQQTMRIAQSLYTSAYCVTKDTLIPLPNGEIVTAKEMIEKKVKSTVGIDDNLKTKETKIKNWFKLPHSKLKKITLKNGDSIKVTHDHKIMVMRNSEILWVPANELTKKDYIAIPDKINVKRQKKPSTIFDIFDMMEKKMQKNIRIQMNKKFKNILKSRLKEKDKRLADLGYKEFTIYKYSSLSRYSYLLIKKLIRERIININDIEKNIESYYIAWGHSKANKLPFRMTEDLFYLFGLVAADGHLDRQHLDRQHLDRQHIIFSKINKFNYALKSIAEEFSIKLSNSKSSFYFSSYLLNRIITTLAIPSGKKCETIDISNFILKQPDNLVWAFIAGFFDGDGSVKLKKTGSGKSKSVRVCFTTKSKKFISKLKLTLLSFGIPSYVYTYPEHSAKDAFDLLIYTDDFEKMTKFIRRHLKIKCDDWDIAEKEHSILKPFRHSYKLIPILGDNLRQYIITDGGIDLSNQFNHKRKIQKHILAKVAKDNRYLQALGCGNIIWKEIKKIEDCKKEDVFDITTETHNFIANGIVVHNCSYPRTSSEKLPPQIGFKQILEALSKVKGYDKICKELMGKELKPTEGKRTDPAHEAIHPTVEPPKRKLSGPAGKIYDLVCRRYFAVFGDPAKRERVKVNLKIGKEKYSLNGRRTLEKGWISYYGPFAKFDEVILPDLKVGDKIDVKKVEKLDKETSPPSRYSAASVIKEMEKRGLGTRATRSAILETLYNRNYIDDKSIRVTDLGMKISETLKKYVPDFVDEEMTKKLEREMEKIIDGKLKKEKIIEEAKEAVTKISDEFKANEKKIGKSLEKAVIQTQEDSKKLGPCPNCGGDLKVLFSIFTKKHFCGCSNYNRCAVCGFTKKACKCKCPICGQPKGKCEHKWKEKKWNPSCETGYPLPHAATFRREDKICEKCNTPIIRVFRKGKRPFRMCLDPLCESKKSWGKPKKGKRKTKKKESKAVKIVKKSLKKKAKRKK